jgi:hypothetical protein
MTRRYMSQACDLLQSAGLLSGIEEEHYQSLQDSQGWNELFALMPERWVVFDCECVYEGDVFASLIADCANATLGEWVPTNIHSTFTPDSTFDNAEMVCTFSWHNEVFRWQFPQSSKWVSDEFFAALFAFAADHLSGTFLEMPVVDQCATMVYLPTPVAQGIKLIMREKKRHWPDPDEMGDITQQMIDEGAWRLRLSTIQAEGTWESLNIPNHNGSLPLQIAIAAVWNELPVGLDVVKVFLRKGASPSVADGEGRTAFELAQGHPLLPSILQGSHHDHQFHYHTWGTLPSSIWIDS